MTDDELSRIRQTLNDALMMVGDPRQNQFAKRGKIEAKLHAATRMIEAAFGRGRGVCGCAHRCGTPPTSMRRSPHPPPYVTPLTESVRAIKALSRRSCNRRLSDYRKRIYIAASRAKITAASRRKKHDDLFVTCINNNLNARYAMKLPLSQETIAVIDACVKRELVR